jgi:hypothetical protein
LCERARSTVVSAPLTVKPMELAMRPRSTLAIAGVVHGRSSLRVPPHSLPLLVSGQRDRELSLLLSPDSVESMEAAEGGRASSRGA